MRARINRLHVALTMQIASFVLSRWNKAKIFAAVVEPELLFYASDSMANHPDDLFQSRYVTPGFKPFSY